MKTQIKNITSNVASGIGMGFGLAIGLVAGDKAIDKSGDIAKIKELDIYKKIFGDNPETTVNNTVNKSDGE